MSRRKDIGVHASSLGQAGDLSSLRGRFLGGHNLAFAFAAHLGLAKHAPGGGCCPANAELYIQASHILLFS
jgi:hypothetical protein